MTIVRPRGLRPKRFDRKIRRGLRLLACCRRGVTALEYGLIVSLVGAAMIVGATTMGSRIGGAYSSFASKVVAY